ncbi:TetR/AcrR family transcriptional regulator [Pseudonocardia halophobica]|uniref:TetR family transcriptional regulator n=1 Tax=Pseudonocardia halophobica TaxID=29401 RepID=A0A9W6NUJ4_9PSEU|nr:TetR/AcrR family transcriptional regulator [Pseudonocardia halophobica]GLL09854.1 TetR family transcriptional regulator [Pseudonocardia halophobica]
MAERRTEMAVRLAPTVHELLCAGLRYRDLSVEQIMAKAGMARSTFYAHFEDKGHLLALLGRDIVDEMAGCALPWTTFPGDGTEDDLRALLAPMLDCYRRHSRLMGALTEEAVSDPRVKLEFERLYRIGRELLAVHVADGRRKGTVDPAVDPGPTIDWLLAMLDRGMYLLVRNSAEDDPGRCATMARIVWLTLYAGAPSRSASPAAAGSGHRGGPTL